MEKLVKLSDVEEMINKELQEKIYIRTQVGASEYELGQEDMLEQLMSSLQSLPTQNEWIPVSERLPSLQEEVLISDGEFIGLGELMAGNGLWSGGMTVKFWQPLPLPPTN